MSHCFLCKPNDKLVYESDATFICLLGYGPIVEGFSVIATRSHIPSMLDLGRESVEGLCDFTSKVRDRLFPHYGNVIITEHGRIGVCIQGSHEPHCYHAHRLVIPVTFDLTQDLLDHQMNP